MPVSRAPVPGGIVSVDRGSIVAVDEGVTAGRVEELGNVAILPGLVNAHTHLELSWMRGQVAPATSMAGWAATLLKLRRSVPHDPPDAIVDAIREARASGTSLVGDISNTLASYEPLRRSELSATVFRELLGFSVSDPDALVAEAWATIAELPPSRRVRTSMAPHAPYSVSPGLFQAIARHAAGRPISVHLGESGEEVQFLRAGTGAWRTLLESLGVWNDAWVPPGCGPVALLDAFGLVAPNLLAVHGVQLTDDELERLATARATLVTCPRSNRWTGAGAPPIERFYKSGVRVAAGTDSLASVESLNMFAELAEMRRLAPSIPARTLLESATRAGAEALGFGSELGTLDPGRQAQMIAVRIPADVGDVEEYLLGGIEPDEIAWLDGD